MDVNTSNKLDLLLEMNKNLLAQLVEQNKLIQELQKENQKISADTTKMALHVDFINAIYARIRHSAFFRTILG
jgi:cell division protein FtsB